MAYDPSENPRSLDDSITDDERFEAERQIAELRQALGHIGKQVGMFRSEGWKVTQAHLYESLQEAVNRICHPETPIEEVPYLRGRITEVQRLMALGDQITGRQEMLKEEIKRLEDEVEVSA